MASETSRSSRRVGTRTNSSSQAPEAEEIVPNSGWTDDDSGHFLLVDLPGIQTTHHAFVFSLHHNY